MAKYKSLKWHGIKAVQYPSNIPFFIHSVYFIINEEKQALSNFLKNTCYYDIKIHALYFNKHSSKEDKKKKSLTGKRK